MLALCTVPSLLKTTFALFRFFGQNVTLERFLVCDLSGTRHFKALLGTGIGFNLWHFLFIFELHP